MTQRYAQHATDLVDGFVDNLEPELAAVFTEDLRDQLALLIESAISTAVVQQMEQIADLLDALAHRARHDAEAFEAPPELIQHLRGLRRAG